VSTDLSNTTALVTGGGVGIGRQIALRLAQAGARVAVTYRNHEPDPELVTALAAGSEAVIVQLDATSETDVAELATTISDRFSTLDILVNNVGGLVRRSTLAQLDVELWRTVMAVNVDSTYLVTRGLLPLITRGRGRVINIASLAGHNGGGPGALAYATSKAAIFGFTRALARELAPDGITVNALAPGFIEATPFHDTFTSAEAKGATIAAIPLGRPGIPDDVASAVQWVASADSSFVTGSVIDINGGQYLR
jgi:3-oxoacyl-[acyl-carrier protein] reductase